MKSPMLITGAGIRTPLMNVDPRPIKVNPAVKIAHHEVNLSIINHPVLALPHPFRCTILFGNASEYFIERMVFC